MLPVLGILGGATLYTLAFPPFDFAIAAWFALVPLLLAVRGRSIRWAFGYGALYGSACAWGVAGWLAQAIGRYFDLGLPAGVAVAGLYAAAFWGTAFGLFAAASTALCSVRPTLSTRYAIPLAWVAAELVRGRAFRQPWALLGYSQHANLALVQIASVTAVYGVSFVVALGNAAVADAIVTAWSLRNARRALAMLGVPALLIVLVWISGVVIIERGPEGGFNARDVAVVQTNVEPVPQWNRAYTERQVMAHIQETERLTAGGPAPALIVWPEYAVPRYLEAEPMLVRQLADVATRHHSDLLFGTPRTENGRLYNSVRLLSPNTGHGGHYDKQRLVLFAETNPLGAVSGDDEFVASHDPALVSSFLPLGVSICHEALFPELIAREVSAGAQLLVNVSNDGWLDAGRGVASRQHFAMAIFRAVETRRFLVRAATTGVSGIVDPYGRVVNQIPPRVAGVVRASVAGRLETTPYTRVGDAFAFACVVGTILILIERRAARRRSSVPQLVPAELV
jgi:apolipoprotein N-acyltransferase